MADYDLGTARGKIEIDADGAVYGFGRADAAAKDFDRSAQTSGANVMRTGAVVAGAGLAIAAGFGFAIKAASDFETRISAISAVSGATEAELEKIRVKALQLGADTKFSAGEAASAMEELVKAGLSVDDVLNGAADAAVNLAAAGEIDLAQAATIAANAMNAFNLEAKEMPHIADLIAGAANASAIDVSEFGMALSQSSAVANLVGLSFDDLAVAIAAMGNAGIKGSDAGTSLKTFLTGLVPVTEKNSGAMKELGLITEDGANQFFDASGKLKSMADISELLKNATKDLGTEQKTMALEAIFGSDAIRAAAVIADGGAESFNALATQMGEVTAAGVAAERMDNLGGSIEQLKGSVETLLIIVGTPLQAALKKWVDGLTGIVNWIGRLDTNVLSIVAKIAGFVSMLLIGVGAVILVAGAIQKVKIAMAALNAMMAANPALVVIAILVALGIAFYQAYQNIEPFRNAVDAVAGAIADFLQPAIESVIGTFFEFWDALTSGFTADEGTPIEMFALRVRDVFIALHGFLFDTFLPALSEFWTALTTGMTIDEGGSWWEDLAFGIRDAVQVIIDIANTFADAVGGWQNVLIGLGVVIAFMLAPLTTLAAAAVYAYVKFEVFRDIVHAIADFLVDDLIPAIIDFAEALVEGFKHAIGWINDNVLPVIQAIGILWIAVFTKMVQAVQLVWPIVQSVFNAIVSVITMALTIIGNLWNTFGDNIMAYIGIVFGVIKTVIESAMSIIQGIIQIVTGIISGDWEKVWDGILSILEGVWNIIQEIPGLALDIIRLAIETFIDIITAIWENGWEIFKTVVGAVFDIVWTVLSTAFEAIVGFIGEMVGNIISWFVGLPGNILGAFNGLPGQLLDVGIAIMNGLWDGLKAVFSFLWTWFTELPGRMMDALGDLGSMLLEAGKKIIQGLIDGILSMKDKVLGAAGDVVGAIRDVLPFSPVKKGPLRILNNGAAGKKIIEMVISGMESMIPALDSIMSSSFNPPVPSMTTSNQTNAPISLVFPNVGNGKDAEEVRRVLGDPSVLSELSRSLRAGVGAA